MTMDKVVFNLDPGGQRSVSAFQPGDADPLEQPDGAAADNPFFPNDPVVWLERKGTVGRNLRQVRRLRDRAPEPTFPSVLWAYHQYSAQRPGAGSTDPPLGVEPVQPENLAKRHARMSRAKDAVHARGTFAEAALSAAPDLMLADPAQSETPNLVLFNVLVALEWEPDDEYLRQLRWAFRRASDFLYDVTDGRMAFGQVLLGDATWLDCADIQIMASNRFHPRSWVGGLHEQEKYIPIRLGRGLWNQRNRVAIPWDEPEAYRALIHEWAHYALDLKDAYLESYPLISAQDAGVKRAHSQILVRRPADEGQDPKGAAHHQRAGTVAAKARVVIQRLSEPDRSIMATLVGTSELVTHAGGDNWDHKWQEWDKIEERFKVWRPGRPLTGPGRLPLPLPQFGCLPRKERQQGRGVESPLTVSGAPAKGMGQPRILPAQTIAAAKAMSAKLAPGVPLHGCRVYVIRGCDQAKPGLIAQGTLDARSEHDGFPLLGAEPSDTVVLVANSRGSHRNPRSEQRPVVLKVAVPAGAAPYDPWAGAVLDAPPIIDVLPTTEVDEANHLASIRVRLTAPDGQALAQEPAEVWVIPLGQPDGAIRLPGTRKGAGWMSEPRPVSTLDGYILIRWDQGENEQLMISAFSQGGGPPSHDLAPIPITGGSSDGDVMLFFHPKPDGATTQEQVKEYSRIQVVTTIDNGAQSKLLDGKPLERARPWSYPFSLATNWPLPEVERFQPTLVVHYDTPPEYLLLEGDLLICRLDGDRWQPQPTFVPSNASFAATPLYQKSVGGSLIAAKPEGDEGLCVERYRLFWIPRGGNGGGGDGAAAGAGAQQAAEAPEATEGAGTEQANVWVALRQVAPFVVAALRSFHARLVLGRQSLRG